MMEWEYVLLGVSSFFNVFLMGFQSKNVQASRYLLAGCTSLGICVANYVFAKTAASGDPTMFILVSGPSGAIGILCAIWVHDHLVKRRK